jgi:hypothetical protein
MKALIGFLAIGMFLFAGCSEDVFFNEGLDGFELKEAHKRANVPIPFKADLFAVPDMNHGFLPFPGQPGVFVPKRMTIGGNGTHLGIVDDSGTSYYHLETFTAFYENETLFFNQAGYGKLVAANGDSFEFTFWAKISTDHSWIGEIVLMPGSGTGKFTGCSGIIGCIGQSNPVEKINRWTCDGYIQYYQEALK